MDATRRMTAAEARSACACDSATLRRELGTVYAAVRAKIESDGEPQPTAVHVEGRLCAETLRQLSVKDAYTCTLNVVSVPSDEPVYPGDSDVHVTTRVSWAAPPL